MTVVINMLYVNSKTTVVWLVISLIKSSHY